MKAKRIREQTFKLRQKVSRGFINKALTLFRKIQADERCNVILRNSIEAAENDLAIERYNEHIRESDLPENEKSELFI